MSDDIVDELLTFGPHPSQAVHDLMLATMEKAAAEITRLRAQVAEQSATMKQWQSCSGCVGTFCKADALLARIAELAKPLNAAMDNVHAWRMGEALVKAAADKGYGDPIDRGLILLRELNAAGFDVVARDRPLEEIVR